MSQSFLLCDPGLLVGPAPGAHDVDSQAHWVDVIRWAADRRVRVGPECRSAAVAYLDAAGWPKYDPPFCPAELARNAREAIGRLMAAALPDRPCAVEDLPEFDPEYVRDAELGCNLALDIPSQHCSEMIGLATRVSHWQRESATVELSLSPPDEVNLVHTPGEQLPVEIDREISRQLAQKRITIVGGLRSDSVVSELHESFGSERTIRWIESEPSKDPSLEGLRSMSGDRDILICMVGQTGILGLAHKSSIKAIGIAKKGGVPYAVVHSPGQIIDCVRLLAG